MRLFSSLSRLLSWPLALLLTTTLTIGTWQHASGAGKPAPGQTAGDVVVVTDEDAATKTKPAAAGPLTENGDKPIGVQLPGGVKPAPPIRVSDEATDPTEPTAATDQQPTPQAGQYEDVEAAALKGIQPGTSTTKQLIKAWGEPIKTEPVDGTTQYVYEIPGFEIVEVYTDKDVVKFIVVVFNQSFEPDVVAQQLKFGDLKAVKVYDKLGRALGQAYPERGVALSYDAGKNPPTVSQILMESISAAAFVARAEQTWKTAHDSALKDTNIAIHLEAGHARAHWLRARILAATGQINDAVAAAGEAVRLAPDEAEYRLTEARIIARTGDFKRAFAETTAVANSLPATSHLKALAADQLGDLIAKSPRPDYKQALKHHMEAIRIAGALATDQQVAIRRAAKHILFDAHLSAANDICWGHWKKKDAVVPRWLGRASSAAEDLILNEGASEELRFQLARRTLSAYAGAAGLFDETATADRLQLTSKTLIAASTDAGYRARIEWETAQGLYQALVKAHSRGAFRQGQGYAQAALSAYEAGAQGRQPAAQLSHFAGRLYFRLGALHAVVAKDHIAAIEWYAKAIPLLEQPVPDSFDTDGAKQGEAFISMGVSYWHSGRRDEALKLTTEGVHLFEKAVNQGLVDESQLKIPYDNMASMYSELGNAEKSKEFAEMAARLKAETLENDTQLK